jgi:hypothetical protein
MPINGMFPVWPKAVKEKLNLDLPVADWAAEEGVDQDTMRERITEAFGCR